MYNFIKTQKIWFAVSGVLAVVSIVFIALGGLKLGIDFTGGSLLNVSFKERPEVTKIEESIKDLNLGDIHIQPAGTDNIIFRLKHIDNEQKNQIVEKMKGNFGQAEEQSFESIGPTIGGELKSKAIVAIMVVLISILAYISWVFRKVSAGPVPSWVYGLGAIIALFHDILIAAGLFAFLGYTRNVEVDALFVTALLTILGFSVHDTIVVYDRIRENIKRAYGESFPNIVNKSINETIVRSLNTSITAILVLFVLYLFGGETLHNFILALIVGFIAGTYSSIFIASPLLLVWQKRWGKR